MKFVRFAINAKTSQGVLESDTIREIQGNLFGEWRYSGVSYATQDVKLLAPLEPNQIIGIGANYVSKVDERPGMLPDIPVFFFKPTSSVIGPGDRIVIPGSNQQVKFESELAVVIGKEARNICESEVLDYIFGYTVGNDVTAPQYFHENGHWTIGKSFDTFTPLGPVIETELNPDTVRVEARLNGVEKQNSGTELMIIPVREMIAYLSRVMTLKPGVVILTGSPLGSELVGAGSVIECEIMGIGNLKNTFVDQQLA
ncbi:2-keto-4-pentenoate hydratase/2-oxohepta-3-ene-1,7-dioic acid hydratase in catechol pathway [Paenibacillus rhizosphaerae]|uniref:2-keto-4-pentenoate hydratase/2-oxohepta-3-ene-1,7-dioic acid hydratase in catechol pathway n=1 Tax=Paenibacillus rhizosphaerae TaxID=297318 RepID=A0A839TQ59_9BACL|nr:fumarylacetoacetate hydrolase family protein [Paenibacillus rhizosphaerae]MBB3129134.1 2-keto-4-pentenoate hydratase/2-oxohepta-3-ene-1,7-dioic acid hydratase in catechol pathway [Paenibacillus rhizosphaerae]